MRGQRPRLHRPARGRDGADGRQGAGEGRRCAQRACRSSPAPRARPARRRRARPPTKLGYPVLLKAAAGGGGKGMRLVDRAGRAARRLPARGRRGARCVRRRDAVRREGDHARASRRDPGPLRQPRHRAHVRRARVLDPAASSEADRGVAVARARPGAARGDGGGRRARVPRTSATAMRGRSSFSSGRTARSRSSS